MSFKPSVLGCVTNISMKVRLSWSLESTVTNSISFCKVKWQCTSRTRRRCEPGARKSKKRAGRRRKSCNVYATKSGGLGSLTPTKVSDKLAAR